MALDEYRRKAKAGEAPSDVLLRKHFLPDLVRVATDETRQVAFTISTGAVDREGDTIAVDGWDVANYLKNPVVLFAHRYSDLPVAKAVSLVKSAGALKATAEFPAPGLYPLADTVYEMLKGGFLRATSVGFRPKKSVHNEERPGWAMDFLEQELLEFSVVPVPANPEALMEAAKSFAGALAAGIDLSPLEEALAVARSVAKSYDLGALRARREPEHLEDEEPVVERSGRTFSAANAALIRNAHQAAKDTRAACMKGIQHLQDLIDQIPEDPDEEEDEPTDDDGEDTSGRAAPAPATTATSEPHVVSTTEELVASAAAAVSAAVSRTARAALQKE